MKLESVNAKGTWSGGKVEQLVLEDPRSLEVLKFMFTDTSSGYTAPMDGEHWERHSPWSNQWNPPVDITNNDPRQCGDGRGEVIPTFDGTNFRKF